MARKHKNTNPGIIPFAFRLVLSLSRQIIVVMIANATASDMYLAMESLDINHLVMNSTMGSRMIGSHFISGLSAS